jgi:cardiolipin synthase A/B
MYEQDLQSATEVVLTARHKARPIDPRKNRRMADLRTRGRSTRRAAAAGVVRMGRTLGAALTARREVGPAEAINLFWSSVIFLAFGLLALLLPQAVAVPAGVLALWLALAGLFRSWRLYRGESEPTEAKNRPETADSDERRSA